MPVSWLNEHALGRSRVVGEMGDRVGRGGVDARAVPGVAGPDGRGDRAAQEGREASHVQRSPLNSVRAHQGISYEQQEDARPAVGVVLASRWYE